MAELNLLQGSEVFEAEKKSNMRFFKWLAVGILVMSVVVWGVLFILNQKADSDIAAANKQQQEIQAKIKADPNYSTLIASQMKVKDLNSLLDKHLVWATVLPKFAAATLKTNVFTKLDADSSGGATIIGSAPDFQNLDKMIKGYQLPDFNYIKDIRLMNVSLGSEVGNQNGINFTLHVLFNTDLLAYKPVAQQNQQQQ